MDEVLQPFQLLLLFLSCLDAGHGCCINALRLSIDQMFFAAISAISLLIFEMFFKFNSGLSCLIGNVVRIRFKLLDLARKELISFSKCVAPMVSMLFVPAITIKLFSFSGLLSH